MGFHFGSLVDLDQPIILLTLSELGLGRDREELKAELDALLEDKGAVDREVFERTYRQVSLGVYEKAAPVWAEVAEHDCTRNDALLALEEHASRPCRLRRSLELPARRAGANVV